MLRNKVINKLTLECAALISNDNHIAEAQAKLDEAVRMLEYKPDRERVELIRQIIEQAQSELEQTSDNNHMVTVRRYIDMAVQVGTEHFNDEQEEVRALDYMGREVGHFRSAKEASEKLGVSAGNVRSVLCGERHTAGGFIFVKVKDKVLIPKTDKHGI